MKSFGAAPPQLRICRSMLVLVALSLFSAPSFASVTSTMIKTDGVVGEFHTAGDAGRHTGVIMLNGSDGGIPPARFASDLAASGYPTLALAYWQDEQDQPKGVPNTGPVPLEIVFRAIEWMKTRPDVDPRHIVLMGVSRGAELTLLVASLRSDIAGVIAYSPGKDVWGVPGDRVHGVKFDRAMWSLNGKPIPFRTNKPDFSLPVKEWFARAPETKGTAIPVEKIRGPILLISSTSDGEWPAARYADEIVQRLHEKDFRWPIENIQYADASHLLLGFGPGMTKLAVPGTNYVIDFGGSTQGTERARDAGWAASKKFLASIPSH